MTNLRKTRILPAIMRRIFAAPYLPRGLVGLTLLIIITDTAIFLISQPPEYWVDYNHAYVGIPWVHQILATHPLLYVGVTIIHIGIIGLFLDGLSRTPALILWVIINFIHGKDLLFWARHILNEQVSLSQPTEYTLFMFFSIVFAGLLGWSAARGLLSTKEIVKPPLLKPKTLSKVAIGGAAIWLFLLAVGLIVAMNAPVSGWLPIMPEHSPGPRVGGEIAYDSHRGKALLFGGSSAWTDGEWLYKTETWEWDGDDWQQLFPKEAPSNRGDLAMAYDEKRQVMVLFGGENQGNVLGDTWEWNGEQWHQLFPSNNPSARRGHRMIYDPQREQVILYGGYDGIETYFNDAWGWDGQQWSQVPFETTSPVAGNFVMVYDQELTRTTVFLGGCSGSTWLWQGARWAQSSSEEDPTYSCGAKGAYDSINKRLVILSGEQDGEVLNNTWLLEGLSWRRINILLSPTARWGHMVFYDPKRERIIMFGGYGNGNVLENMWEFVLLDDD